MKLYDFPLSGNCYKVRLMLSFLDIPAQTQQVELAQGQQRSPDFLALNPLGQVPVVQDGDITLHDSNAILIYLTARYDIGGHWLPKQPEKLAQLISWLSLASNEIANGPAALRLVRLFNASLDIERAQTLSKTVCNLLEHKLSHQAWLLEGAEPSVADVACYPYLALSGDGGWSLETFPAIRGWLTRFETLPRFVPLLAESVV